MPESLYRLNHQGKKELKSLLDKAKCPSRKKNGHTIWNRSWLHQETGLDHDPLQRILQVVDPSAKPDELGLPVQQGSLLQLFQKLGARQSELMLCKFWSKCEDGDSISKRPERLAMLLRSLDYRDQQYCFDVALRDCPGIAAFLIPTPCDRSQQWAINRLVGSINNVERAIRIPLINVKAHPIRCGDIDLLWQELAKKLKIPQDRLFSREKILEKLYQSSKNRPIIIALYNFSDDDDITPVDIIQEFWLPLVQGMANFQSRNALSRIVLLIANRDLPDCLAEEVIQLPSLDRISQNDVAEWLLDKKTVYPWCCDEFGRGWVENFIHSECSGSHWKWNNPGKVLDQICFGFGLKNGIQDLRRRWEWS